MLQVGLAFAQVLVLHFVELAGDDFQLGGQRPFGVVQALGDPVFDAGHQIGVLQQHQVHVQQRPEFVRRLFGAHLRDGFLQAVNFVDDRIAAHAYAVDLGFDLMRLHKVMGHIHAAGCDQHRTANCHAARYVQTVDSEGHAVTRNRG